MSYMSRNEDHIRFVRVMANVAYRPEWTFTVGEDAHSFYLQVSFPTVCIDTGAELKATGRKWRLSPFMTDSEVVSTAFKACVTAEEHECRERFTFRRIPVFGPHLNVEDLASAIRDGRVRKDMRA